MKKAILFLIVFSIFTASKGQRIWVISNSGNNTNSGTKSNPLETVQAGIDSCKSGDTVILTEGTYLENLVYPSGKKIILGSELLLDKKEAHISKTIIDGSNYYGNNPLFYTSSGEFHVIGITITGAPKQVFATWNTNNSSIRKCNFTDCGNSSIWGVVFTQGNTSIDSCTFSKNFGRYIVAFGRVNSTSALQRIERCTFIENGGISYVNSPDYAEIFVEDRVIIRSCLFYKNNQTCIATGGNGGVDSVLIINNTITNNLSYGIAFHNWGGGSLNIVYNNIIQNNNQYNLYFNNSGYSIVLLRKNIIFPYLRKVPYYPSRYNFKITDFGQDTVSAIVLNKDYSLPNNSRAIGYGYSSKFTIRDIYGITQPNPTGSNPDVGAIENSAGFSSPTLIIAEGGNKKITVTYSQSAVTGLKKYKLYRSTKPISDTATVGLIVDTLSATNLSYKDSGLTNLTKYYYRIKGVLTSGLESGFSNELSAKPNTPPAAPDSILVQNGARLNYITWNASKSKSVKYRVYRGLSATSLQVIRDTTSKLSFLDTGLTAWKKYYYAIRCIDTVGVPSAYSTIKIGVPNNIWWVDTAGNDNNIGSNAFPFATIENAIKKAQSSSHDTIYIKQGLHKANINPNGKNIVIEGYMGSQYTIIEPKNTNDNLIYLSNGEPRTMIIKGLTFQNALFTLKSSPDRQYCNANIQNCVFTKCGSPNSGSPVIQTHYGGLRFDNCIFYKNLGHTMYFDYKDTSGGMGNFFVNCLFIDNYRYAGGGQNGPGRIYFSNCILWETQKDTLQELSVQANSYIFQNCIIKDNYFSKTASNKNVDPKFVNVSNGDFRIQNSSEAIGAGQSKFIQYGYRKIDILNSDFVNSRRPYPSGTNPDIGAFENNAAFHCPTLISVEGGNKKITLTYSQSAVTGLKKYKLYRSTKPISDTATVGLIVDTLSASNLSYKDSGLTNLTKYYYRIKGVLTSGLESGFSNELSAKPNTPPAAPDSISVFNGPHRVALTWPKSKSSPVTYRLIRLSQNKTEKIFYISNSNSFEDTTVLDGQIYQYRVCAVDTVNVSSSFTKTKSGRSYRLFFVSKKGQDSIGFGYESKPMNTIQFAINSSRNGDTILVEKGIYKENVIFKGKAIILASRFAISGNKQFIDSTIIDGNTAGCVVRIINNEGEGTEVCGLVIQNGYSNEGAGINTYIYNGKIKFKNLIVRNNTAGAGGGLFAFNKTLLIENCIFLNNTASRGSAIYLETSAYVADTAKILNCEFFANNGTSIYFIGRTTHTTFVNNCLIHDEKGENILMVEDNVWLNNTTIVNNTPSSGGSVLYMYYGSANLNNCIFRNPNGKEFASLASSTPGSIKLTNCNIRGGYTGTGNFDEDPGFIKNSYKLSNSSTSIGKGNKNNLIKLDMDGLVRPNPIGSNPDLGAFENSAAFPCPILITAEGGNKKITVTYSQSAVTGLKKYKLYRSTKPISDTATVGLIVDTLSATNLSYKDSGLTNLTKYYYRIKGVLTSGLESGFSNELSARPNTPPAAPDSILVQNGARLNYITWNASKSKPVKYRVYRGLSANSLQVIRDTTSTLSFLDTGLTAWKKYYYAIRCIDTVGVPSAYSVIKTGVPNNIWWVSKKGNNSNLGIMNAPFSTIQYGINKSTNGDSVVVMRGKYIENIIYNGKEILVGSNFVFNSQSIEIDSTIIDGNTAGCVVRISNNEGKKTELIGFTIQNGYSNQGAGIYATSPFKKLRYLKVKNNKAAGDIDGGGGIIGGSCLIENCIFFNNYGRKGGALAMVGGDSDTSKLINNEFYNNEAWECGSALMYCTGSKHIALIYNNIIHDNIGQTTLHCQNTNIKILNSTVVNNKPSSTGVPINYMLAGKIEYYNSIIRNPGYSEFGSLVSSNPGAIVVKYSNVLGSYKDSGNFDESVSFIPNTFKLANNATSIGRGSNNYLYKKDFIGSNRPNPTGSNPDIGAFENSAGFPCPLITNVSGGYKKAILNWTQYSYSGLNKYKIYRSTKPITDTATIGVIVDTLRNSIFTYKDSGLTNLTKYYYRIKSINSGNIESLMSNQVEVTPNTPPYAPDSLFIEKGPRTLEVTWNKSNSNSVKRYALYRKTLGNKVLLSDTIQSRRYLDTGLIVGQNYEYTVYSIDTVGVISTNFISKNSYASKIWYVSSNGKNSNLGSKNKPLLTIDYTMNRAIKGDTIVLLDGTYKERINFTNRIIHLASEYVIDKDERHIANTHLNGFWTSSTLIYDNNIQNSYAYRSIIGLTIDSTKGSALYMGRINLDRVIFKGIRNSNIANIWNGVLKKCQFLNSCTWTSNVNPLMMWDSSSVEDCIFDGLVFHDRILHVVLPIRQEVSFKRNKFINNIPMTTWNRMVWVEGNGKMTFANNLIIDKSYNQAYGFHWSGSATTDTVYVLNNTFIGGRIALWINSNGIGNFIVENNLFSPYSYGPYNSLANTYSRFLYLDGNGTGTVWMRFRNNHFDTSTGFALKLIPNINYIDTTGSKNNWSSKIDYIDPSTNNYALKSNSKDIGAGTIIPRNLIGNFDLLGKSRIQPTGTYTDLGAIENSAGFPCPTLITAEGGNKKITVTYSQSAVTGLKKYKLYRSTKPISDTATVGLIVDTLSATNLSYKDSGLTNLTKYYYRIKGVLTSGLESGFSNELSARPNTPPAAPDSILVQNGARLNYITWNASKSKPVKYRVYRGLSATSLQVIRDTTSKLSFLDTGLTAWKKYYYAIRCIDTVGVPSAYSLIKTGVPNNIWWVDTAGNDNNIGASWSPLKNIETGLAIAKSYFHDTVFVNSGLYYCNMNFNGKNIVLLSKNGPKKTILEPRSIYSPVIKFENNEPATCQIEGFMVRNANDSRCVSVGGSYTKAIVRNMIFTASGKNIDGLVSNHYGGVTYENCLFVDNPGIIVNACYKDTVNNSGIIFNHCVFYNNADFGRECSGAGPGKTQFYNSIFWNNNNGVLNGDYWMQNCSIDDTSYSNKKTNYKIRPKFTDPKNFDYSLLNSSELIGKASGNITKWGSRKLINAVLDFNNKLRPNPTGSNPDIGAIENTNAFPCPFVDSARTFGDTAIIYYTVNTLNKGTKILLNFYDSLNTIVLKDSVTINSTKSAYVYKTTNLSIGKRYGINLSQNFAGIGISNLVRFNMLSIPNLVSPANNLFRQGVNLNLVWKKSKTAQFARVQLSKFANYSTLISDKTQIKDTFSITGLSLNTTYYWRVYSKDSCGRSFYSNSFKFQTIPQTPKFDSIATRPKVAKLFWKITDTTNINKFYIYRDSSIANSTLIDSVSNAIRTYSDSTIKEGKRYYYKIKLVNKQFVLSDFSNTKAVNILVPPALVSPANLSNSLVLNQLLKWKKPIQAQYADIQVAYNDSNFKTTILSKHQNFDSVFLSSAAVNRTYYWRFRSTDSLGYGNWSKIYKFQTLVPKPVISSINSVAKASTLSWTVSDTFNIAKYFIYRDTSINASILIDSVSKQFTSYTDNSVLRNNKYYYRIKALNNERILSVFSNERVISILDYPALISPKNNSVSIIRSPKIVWKKSKFATKIKYEVSLDSAFTSPLNSTYTTLDSIQLNNLKYSNYYYWRVRCEDSLSIGSWSNPYKFQTLVQTPSITKLNSTYKKSYLTWSINDTNNLKGFYILRDTINNPTKIIDSLQSWRRNYIDTPLLPSTRYYYSIIAYNKQFVRGAQSTVRGVNLLEHPILSTPLYSSAQISVNTNLTWQNSKYSQNYKIQVSKDKLFSTIIKDVTVSNSSYSLTGLLKNTNYYWRIKSLDSVGSSNWSDTFKFQTEIQIPNILGITTSHKQAKVTWNLSDTTNLSNIKGFYIYRDTFPSATTLIDSVYLPTKQYNDLSVELGKLYYYRLKTINNQYILSEFSNERRAAILNYPTLIKPTDTLKKSELLRVFHWSKEKYATKYQIQLAYTDSFKTPIIDQTLILDSIQLLLNRFNYNYFWRVRSKDSIGISKWSSTWYFQTKLFKPSIDTLIAANKKVNIYWLKSDTQNIKEYRVYRSDNTLNPVLVNRVTSLNGKNSYSYLDSGLINFKRYYYWISAVNNQYVESELSSIKDAFTFNIKPNVSKIKDTVITNVGRNTRYKVVFSQEKAFDKDGKIDSTIWYIEGVKVKVDTFLAYKFHQGTTKVMAVVFDNDLASDTTMFNVSLMAFQKQFRAGITSGITMFDENSIYVADTSLNSFNYGEVVKLDTNGTIDFNLLVTQRIRNTPAMDFKGNLYITNGPLVNSFSYTGAPLCNEINLGAISQVTPTFDSVLNRLYIGVSNRKFFAIDLDNQCKVKWDFTSDAPISAPAVVSAGRKLIFTDLSGKLYGFDVTYSYLPKTGSAPTWKFATGDSIYLAPAIDTSERIIVGTANGKLLKLNLDTLNKVSVVWSTKVGKKITTSPVLDAFGNIFVGCSDGRIVKIKSSTGDTISSFNTGASIFSTPAISDQSLIYVANTKGELFCFDSALILQWKYYGKDPITSHLVHSNGATYVGTQNGKFMSFYDLNLDASIGSIKTNITKRKLNKIAKPIWGTFQGNIRRTGVQDAIFREVFIERLEDKDVKLFPNPTNEKFNIESTIGMSHITITNVHGATVQDIDLNNLSRLTVSTLNLSNGVYFVRIFTNKGNIVKKVIIQK